MSSENIARAAVVLTSTANLSTSTPYPMARGATTLQATVKATTTGTSNLDSTLVVNASNDNQTYFAIGTLTVIGTLAAAGTSSSTATKNLSIGISPYAFLQLVVSTLTTGISAAITANITQ